jgi:hypothetical protein
VVPGNLSRIVQQDSFDVTQGDFEPQQRKNLEEIFDAYEKSLLDADA